MSKNFLKSILFCDDSLVSDSLCEQSTINTYRWDERRRSRKIKSITRRAVVLSLILATATLTNCSSKNIDIDEELETTIEGEVTESLEEGDDLEGVEDWDSDEENLAGVDEDGVDIEPVDGDEEFAENEDEDDFEEDFDTELADSESDDLEDEFENEEGEEFEANVADNTDTKKPLQKF